MIILFKNLGWTSNWQESKRGLLFGVHTCRGRMYNQFGVQYKVGTTFLAPNIDHVPPAPTHSLTPHAPFLNWCTNSFQIIIYNAKYCLNVFHICMFGLMNSWFMYIWIKKTFLHQWKMKAQWIISNKNSTM
jgi:hypothetical protein